MKIDGLNKTDWLMMVLIAVILYDTDYSNLQAIDYVLLVSVTAWLIMLGIRLYVVNVKNKR
ncbi:MAG: hypothetical protein II778_00575 [Anaerovibrio sp.]|uniref:hypothetical protein n=1 Tax=Anaerovibrio sp. TaxID=1872532 RepID=UPI0025B9B9FD|nr:hypothetical protein [Anaerovibrio sp.]MBE6099943.1 hypothetical protein [Anaerovibrio sp.]MBQ3853175.1 hypothetical protein [Anaerovibrio sp.]